MFLNRLLSNRMAFNLLIFFPQFHFTGSCRLGCSLLLLRIRLTFRVRSELIDSVCVSNIYQSIGHRFEFIYFIFYTGL